MDKKSLAAANVATAFTSPERRQVNIEHGGHFHALSKPKRSNQIKKYNLSSAAHISDLRVPAWHDKRPCLSVGAVVEEGASTSWLCEAVFVRGGGGVGQQL